MDTTVSRYFTTRERKIAIVMMVEKLGLQEKLSIAKKSNEVTEEAFSVRDKTLPSSHSLSIEEDLVAEEDAVFSEIFNTPDCAPSLGTSTLSNPPSDISSQNFTRTVLSMKGLVGMLSHCHSNMDKIGILDTGHHGDQEEHPVYVILSFISQEMILSKNETLEEGSCSWMKDGVGTIMELVNLCIEHQFLSDSLDISGEFLRHSLENLVEMQEHMRDPFLDILAMMGGNKILGKQVVLFLLSQFSETGNRLREALLYRLENDSMDTFAIYMNLMLGIWPFYVEAVCPPLGGKGGGARKKEKNIKPRLSLGETTDLTEEVTCWREVLDECTLGLTVFYPQFCEGVGIFDKFCQGLLSSLTRQG